MEEDLEISVAAVKQRVDSGAPFCLIDVREPWEYDAAHINGARLIPMGSIPTNLNALDTGDEVICYCHHGQRSLDVAFWLRSQGVERAKSMAGGIDRWSIQIDPGIPRY
jgi:rhodanese-related sulfurtransferase